MNITELTKQLNDPKQRQTVYGYIRVSSYSQLDNTSLENQEQKIKEFCKLNNYDLKEIISDTMSGKKDDRAGFIRLQDEIDSVNGIVSVKIDRLFRSLSAMSKLIELIEQKDKFIHTADGIDTRTKMGQFVAKQFGLIAELEADVIRERVMAGRYRRFKELGKPGGKGKGSTGIAPLGYYWEGDVLRIDHKLSEHIEHIFKMRKQGQSFYAIADYLAEQGIKSPRDNHYSRQAVQKILKNPFYIGETWYGKDNPSKGHRIFRVDRSHKPVVSKQLFNSVNPDHKESDYRKDN